MTGGGLGLPVRGQRKVFLVPAVGRTVSCQGKQSINKYVGVPQKQCFGSGSAQIRINLTPESGSAPVLEMRTESGTRVFILIQIYVFLRVFSQIEGFSPTLQSGETMLKYPYLISPKTL